MKIKNVKKITDEKHLNLFSISYEDRENCDKTDIPHPVFINRCNLNISHFAIILVSYQNIVDDESYSLFKLSLF